MNSDPLTKNDKQVDRPAVIDYEGSDYRTRFWQGQGREYEDLAERIALGKLLPPRGRRLVEVGAAFGRLVDCYAGYDQVILLDYSRSLLSEARERLGAGGRFIYVAANVYELPLAAGAVDTAVMVRVMHHLADVPAALAQIRQAVAEGGSFVAEYASKRHLKAIARYLLGQQAWSPFDLDPYEFVSLNFDFHPRWMDARLQEAGFQVGRQLTVSHFRLPLLKRLVPPGVLASLDGLIQGTGAWWQLTPSIFVDCRVPGAPPAQLPQELFCCPRCRQGLVGVASGFDCPNCHLRWPLRDGIYDFKEPLPAIAP